MKVFGYKSGTLSFVTEGGADNDTGSIPTFSSSAYDDDNYNNGGLKW